MNVNLIHLFFVKNTQRKGFFIMSKKLVAFFSASGTTKKVAEMIAEEAKTVEGFEFVWITDGGGWTSARRNLEETFDVMEHLYNIADMEQKIFTSLFV